MSSPELFRADILAEPETRGRLLDAYGARATLDTLLRRGIIRELGS